MSRDNDYRVVTIPPEFRLKRLSDGEAPPCSIVVYIDRPGQSSQSLIDGKLVETLATRADNLGVSLATVVVEALKLFVEM